MRDLYFRLAFTAIISILIVFFAGCSVGIRPRADDMPKEADAYYEESVHGTYYDVGPRTGGHYYDPSYDPWTMGGYYQHYSGTPRSEASTSSTKSESTRPAVKSRDSASTHQSKAPSSKRPSLKRDRSTIRSRTNKDSDSEEDKPVNTRKTRRTVRRGTSQASQEKHLPDESHAKQRREKSETNSRKTRRKPTSSESEKEDEEKNGQ